MNKNPTARMNISVYPLGTGETSFSMEISKLLVYLDKSGLVYETDVMGTTVEGELDELFTLARDIHSGMFSDRVKRVLTVIKIDERRDR